MAHKLSAFHGGDFSKKFVVTLNDTILKNASDLLVQNDIHYGAYSKYVGGGWKGGVGVGGQKVLQIFQKNICSPGDQRPKYFMAQ